MVPQNSTDGRFQLQYGVWELTMAPEDSVASPIHGGQLAVDGPSSWTAIIDIVQPNDVASCDSVDRHSYMFNVRVCGFVCRFLESNPNLQCVPST